MASSTECGAPSSCQQPDAASRDSMEEFFFNIFNGHFLHSIGQTGNLLNEKFTGLLSDIIENLHRLSKHASDMVRRQGLTFNSLSQEEQSIFINEFLRQIDVFADKVTASFEALTPEQEKKLLEAYSAPRPTDN